MSDAELARLFEDLLNAESENSKTTATTTVLQQQERRGLDDNNTNDSFFSSNQQQQETYTFNRGSPSIDQQFENETTAAAPTEENESISTARAMDEIEERIEQQLQDVEAEAAARNSSSIGQSKEEEEDSKTKAAVAVQVVQKFARDFRVEDVKLAAASVGTISVGKSLFVRKYTQRKEGKKLTFLFTPLSFFSGFSCLYCPKLVFLFR
jgi:hypothetical protein